MRQWLVSGCPGQVLKETGVGTGVQGAKHRPGTDSTLPLQCAYPQARRSPSSQPPALPGGLHALPLCGGRGTLWPVHANGLPSLSTWVIPLAGLGLGTSHAFTYLIFTTTHPEVMLPHGTKAYRHQKTCQNPNESVTEPSYSDSSIQLFPNSAPAPRAQAFLRMGHKGFLQAEIFNLATSLCANPAHKTHV